MRRAWCAHDVGRAINPISCEGQIQGGFVQGMGYALTEEMHWNDRRLAHHRNARRLQGAGRARFAAPEIHAIVLEDPDPTHPVGAKGSARPALVGAAPAIANAIRNATGARVRTLPMTPERVLDALDALR